LELPGAVRDAVYWLIATLNGECGPDNPKYPVALRHLYIKGGRGSGKSHSVARILELIGTLRPWRFLCARETQKSIEESVKQLIDDVIFELGDEDVYDSKKLTIDGKEGSQFLFAGLRNQDVNKLKSTERIMIAWCEEAHVLSQRSLEVLVPTVREENSVIIYTYNPELDDDPVHENAMEGGEDVCVVTMNHRDNPWFPKVLEAERIRTYNRDKTPGKVKYNWIWEGKCLPAVEGAIFANEVAEFQEEGRFRLIDHDPLGHVHVVMDLGYGVTTMLLCQRFASTVQCIDYFEFYQTKYSVMSDIIKKAWPHVQWGKVFMPHDASHKDPKYAKSHKDVMKELGWRVEDIEQIGIENYIDRGREAFSNTYLDNKPHETEIQGPNYERGGKRLLQCLKRSRRQVPETTGHPGLPMKDEFSHGMETWCYAAVVADQMTNDSATVTDPYKAFRTGGGWT
jgi:phage terminase large subunit